MQKIVAFENAFERLIDIIEGEGYSDGGVCLYAVCVCVVCVCVYVCVFVWYVCVCVVCVCVHACVCVCMHVCVVQYGVSS